MRIEQLRNAPDRAGRYWVTFSDGTRLGLYRQTVEDFGLYPGKELEEAELSRLREAAGQMSAKMRAVRIVSASSVSRKDLEQRLVRKGEDPEQAKAAFAWMEDLHLVDDRATAEQVVHSCIAKGYWEEALADYPDQEAKIEQFLRARLDGDSDEKQIKRAIDALLRRGHSYGTVKRVLNTLSFDCEDVFED